jgi:hypothetical protein
MAPLPIFIHATLLALFALNLQGVLAVFKCSPLDGTLDTYSFTHGTDNGVACVRGSGQSDLVFFLDKLSPDGTRKLAVGTAKFSAADGLHRGYFYRLFPSGPKQVITIKAVPGFMELNLEGGPSITWNLRPDGIAWTPADLRVLNGCAMENPQLYLNIQNPQANQQQNALLCAMTADPGSGYNALYGFGLRVSKTGQPRPYFYLGQPMSAIIPSTPLNVVANIMEICYKSDCTHCRYPGLKSITLNS